ncbi:SDR family oxidoreductase [uncultured Litoreibacter sp.]|uniref:SDR family oxidoreductase n=1 Tax=uncultured Litoreibacter sp. TaxID=1392394 RepID=UPI0026374604|nr:SDR family oxidoreductase [uncultured Litoreibacter sp.]
MQLQDKIAVITGATSGIGYAAAERFIAEGVKTLVITGQDEARLDAARSKLANGDTNVVAIRWRAEHAEDSLALSQHLKAEFGSIDILFANAGVTWPAPLGQIDAARAQAQIMINFTAPLMLVQSLAPLMNAGGSIVMNTSCLDELGMPGMAVYSASKAALRSATRTLSAELGEQQIRVNAVAPGPIETPLYGKIGMTEEQLAEMASGIVAQVPAGRFGTAEEIANAVLFLASDASSYMRGAEIAVDGGWTSL